MNPIFFSTGLPSSQEITRELESQFVELFPNVVAALIILLIVLVISKIVDSLFHRFIRRVETRRAHVFNLTRQTVKALILIIGGVTILATLGINVSALIASLGLTGFALGFALRDALSNLLAGALILLYRPFGISDHIIVAGFEGTVTDIDLRYTTLTVEGKTFLIPNSVLFTNPITVVDQAHLKN